MTERFVIFVRSLPHLTIQNNLHYLQNNSLEHAKKRGNDNKFTIGKYHINTMENIKLFQLSNYFMPVTKFLHLTILLFCKRRPFQIFDSSGEFSKKLTTKIGEFELGKKGRENT